MKMVSFFFSLSKFTIYLTCPHQNFWKRDPVSNHKCPNIQFNGLSTTDRAKSRKKNYSEYLSDSKNRKTVVLSIQSYCDSFVSKLFFLSLATLNLIEAILEIRGFVLLQMDANTCQFISYEWKKKHSNSKRHP